MMGDESRPDSGDAGAACPPAGSARAGSVHRFLGALPGRARRVAQNPSMLAAVFRSPLRCGGRVHTRAGRRPDPGGDMTQATTRYATLTPRHLQHREHLDPNGQHPKKQRNRRQRGSFLNHGPKHDDLPDARTNREHSSCFVPESRGAASWNAGGREQRRPHEATRIRSPRPCDGPRATAVTRPAARGTIWRGTAGSKRRSGLCKNRPCAGYSARAAILTESCLLFSQFCALPVKNGPISRAEVNRTPAGLSLPLALQDWCQSPAKIGRPCDPTRPHRSRVTAAPRYLA